ncbi:hypothetical protein H2198_004593 [Neophaeococcomyces mojaviensis]|uniref:Uncharacterized protein n=1 Tax=Neophaeococcomyces mojaviensis TaxID=3383035 RepID=A0ACC3A8E0_9EURO|nr:hypothetical protein H2198_004593 [Knufia sp. JES_112]
MPPKKMQAAKAASKKQKAEEEKQVPDRTKEEQAKVEEPAKEEEMPDAPAEPEDQEEEDSDSKAAAGQKRKSPPTTSNDKLKPPKKEARQGSRASSRQAGGGTAKSTPPKQILNFLLSKDSLQYCFPDEELDAARSGKFPKSYSLTPPSLFTPFEHLVSAHLLSKPLSHTLGMRSIRTLLNSPYSFSTPAALKNAGEDKIYKALEDTKTQHRQKTAQYLADIGTQYSDPKGDDKGDAGDSDEMLELATQANDGGARATIAYVKNSVKGMGQTGAEIFCRRVQACDGWGEAIWPYADPKAIDSLRECGVKVADAEHLQEMIESDIDWEKVGDMGLVEEKKGVDDKDYEVQVAVEFVTVLERAVGCVLEGRVDELKQAASEWK